MIVLLFIYVSGAGGSASVSSQNQSNPVAGDAGSSSSQSNPVAVFPKNPASIPFSDDECVLIMSAGLRAANGLSRFSHYLMIAAAILGVVVLVDRMYCRKSKEKDSV